MIPEIDPFPFEKLKPEMPIQMQTMGQGDLLLGYQQRSIKALDENSVVVIEKSRRIGLTWGLAAHAALTAATQKKSGGQDVFYMGYEKEMAREFIDVVGMWAKAFAFAASEVSEFVFGKDDHDQEIKAFRVTFASGFEVVALPSKPRAFRGKQGLVILDEAAFMDDVQETIDAAMALLIWGGSVVIVSTHYGIDNPFNKLCDEIKAGNLPYKLLTITFDDAINDGLYERVKLVSRRPIADKEAWIADIRSKMGDAASQELDCIPMMGGMSWLTPSDITAAENTEAGVPENYLKSICFTGYDVARRRDYSVICTLEKIGEVLWVRKLWAEKAQTFRQQYDEFENQINGFRVVKAGIDQTGMGERVVEELQEKYGRTRIEGIYMSPPRRLDLAFNLRTMFEQGKIRIPANDSNLRSDLLALKRAGREGKALMETKEKHADIFWALAFAVWCASQSYEIYEYQSPSSKSFNDNEEQDFWSNNRSRAAQTRHGLTKGAF